MEYVVIQGKTPAGKVKAIDCDYSGSITIIPHEHQKVHAGELFAGGYGAIGVAAFGSIDILFRTPADITGHVYLKIGVGADAAFLVYENPTLSADGTAITLQNHNRGSAKTPSHTAFHSPTITDLGTLIWSEYAPGGSGVNSPGAIQTISTEQMVTAPDTDYIFRLTNLDSAAQTCQITFSFYEV